MKFKLLTKFFLLFFVINSSFASPFDVGELEDEITESEVQNLDEKEDKKKDLKNEEKPKANESKSLENEALQIDVNEKLKSEEKIEKPKQFKEMSEVNLKIVNIHSGMPSEVKLKIGGQETFDGVNLQLEKCYKSIDENYDKISIAYITLSSRDFKRYSATFSSDLALSSVIASKYIVKAECF
jgi:hypothetical protein